MCLSINQLFYDPCSDSHIFPNTRLSQIEMEVSSAVKFLVVLRDTRQSENFFTGRKQSNDMVKKYKKHHYENRFRRIEEALDDLKAKLISLERCDSRSEEHTSELQSRGHLVCRLLLEKKQTNTR